MPPIPEGLTVTRDPSGRGLLASWWGVQVATVASNPDVPGGLHVTQTASASAFTSEGIGTLNGWLPVASPDDLLQALGEPTTAERWAQAVAAAPESGTCWCGQQIIRVGEVWQHAEPQGHEARPA